MSWMEPTEQVMEDADEDLNQNMDLGPSGE